MHQDSLPSIVGPKTRVSLGVQAYLREPLVHEWPDGLDNGFCKSCQGWNWFQVLPSAEDEPLPFEPQACARVAEHPRPGVKMILKSLVGGYCRLLKFLP